MVILDKIRVWMETAWYPMTTLFKAAILDHIIMQNSPSAISSHIDCSKQWKSIHIWAHKYWKAIHSIKWRINWIKTTKSDGHIGFQKHDKRSVVWRYIDVQCVLSFYVKTSLLVSAFFVPIENLNNRYKEMTKDSNTSVLSAYLFIVLYLFQKVAFYRFFKQKKKTPDSFEHCLRRLFVFLIVSLPPGF